MRKFPENTVFSKCAKRSKRRHLFELQEPQGKRAWLEAFKCDHLVARAWIEEVQVQLIFVIILLLARRLAGLLLHKILVLCRVRLHDFFEFLGHLLRGLVEGACRLDSLNFKILRDITIQCREDMASAFDETWLHTL